MVVLERTKEQTSEQTNMNGKYKSHKFKDLLPVGFDIKRVLPLADVRKKEININKINNKHK